MTNQWTGSGIWQDWYITAGGVLTDPLGKAYGPGDITGTYSQADLAAALNVSRAAITGRINRGTLPEFDGHDANGRGYWRYNSIKDILTSNKAPDQ